MNNLGFPLSTKLIGTLCVAAAALTGEIALAAGAQQPAQGCARDAVVKMGKLSAGNDIWGSYGDTDYVKNYHQCMTGNVQDGSLHYEWNFLHPSKGVKSYPHVNYGWEWGSKDSKIDDLPMSVANLKPVFFDYDIDTKSTGNFNVSFDIWMSRLQLPTNPKDEVTHEVMIWLDKQGMVQGQRFVETAKVGGYDFDLYMGPMPPSVGHWMYVAFLAKQPMRKQKLDVTQFISYLKKRGIVQDQEFVNGISLGSEITDGVGTMDIRKLVVTPN